MILRVEASLNDRGGHRLAGFIEQGALAAGNLVAFLVFARLVSPAVWGQFGFAYAMVLFAQGFQRATVTIPLVSYSANVLPWTAARGHWQSNNAAFAVVVTAILLATAASAHAAQSGWLARSATMAAAMSAPVFLHEFVRRSLIQEGRFDTLVLSGLAYGVVVVGVALALPWMPWADWTPMFGVAAAATAAVVVASLRTARWPVSRPRVWSPAPDYRQFAGWAALSHLGFSGYNFGVQALLAGISGPVAVGVFHACRVLVQPVNTIIGATDSVDKPRAAAALASGGKAGMAQVLGRSLALMSLLALPFLGAVAWFAPWLLATVLGPQYADQSLVLRLWCLVAVTMLLAQPVESGLYVARRTRPMFIGRLLASCTGLALAWPLVQRLGAAGALVAVAAGYSVAAVAGFWSLRGLPARG